MDYDTDNKEIGFGGDEWQSDLASWRDKRRRQSAYARVDMVEKVKKEEEASKLMDAERRTKKFSEMLRRSSLATLPFEAEGDVGDLRSVAQRNSAYEDKDEADNSTTLSRAPQIRALSSRLQSLSLHLEDAIDEEHVATQPPPQPLIIETKAATSTATLSGATNAHDKKCVERTIRISYANSQRGCGFSLDYDSQPVRVSRVTIGSAADINDLRKDDLVLQINGRDVHTSCQLEVNRLVEEITAANSQLVLMVRRFVTDDELLLESDDEEKYLSHEEDSSKSASDHVDFPSNKKLSSSSRHEELQLPRCSPPPLTLLITDVDMVDDETQMPNLLDLQQSKEVNEEIQIKDNHLNGKSNYYNNNNSNNSASGNETSDSDSSKELSWKKISHFRPMRDRISQFTNRKSASDLFGHEVQQLQQGQLKKLVEVKGDPQNNSSREDEFIYKLEKKVTEEQKRRTLNLQTQLTEPIRETELQPTSTKEISEGELQLERERLAKEARERELQLEREKLAKEARERELQQEREKLAKEAREWELRLERDRLAKEAREKELQQEREKLAKEARKRELQLEREKLAKEAREWELQLERERLAKEARERELQLERERLAKEARERELQEREKLAKEARERELQLEREKLAKEARERELQQEREKFANEARERELQQEREKLAKEARERQLEREKLAKEARERELQLERETLEAKKRELLAINEKERMNQILEEKENRNHEDFVVKNKVRPLLSENANKSPNLPQLSLNDLLDSAAAVSLDDDPSYSIRNDETTAASLTITAKWDEEAKLSQLQSSNDISQEPRASRRNLPPPISTLPSLPFVPKMPNDSTSLQPEQSLQPLSSQIPRSPPSVQMPRSPPAISSLPNMFQHLTPTTTTVANQPRLRTPHFNTMSTATAPIMPPYNKAGQENLVIAITGKKKCASCRKELGYGTAMIIETLQLYYHVQCFRCSICYISLGSGDSGAEVRVLSHRLHCKNCFNFMEGYKYKRVLDD